MVKIAIPVISAVLMRARRMLFTKARRVPSRSSAPYLWLVRTV